MEFLPKNPFSAIAMGDMVQILVFALIFAIALAKIGEISRPVISFFESVFAATMKVTDWIMYFAAPGVFALTATSIASFGLDIFSSISKYTFHVPEVKKFYKAFENETVMRFFISFKTEKSVILPFSKEMLSHESAYFR